MVLGTVRVVHFGNPINRLLYMFPPISGEVANYYYSVRLYRSEGSLTQQVTFAFFCVSLCQSAHIKVCHVHLLHKIVV